MSSPSESVATVFLSVTLTEQSAPSGVESAAVSLIRITTFCLGS